MAIADGESIGRIKFEMTEVSSRDYICREFLLTRRRLLADAAAVRTAACQGRRLISRID